jgi:hypothetical protein
VFTTLIRKNGFVCYRKAKYLQNIMEHIQPDPYLPNPNFYFVARRMRLPLNYKSKVSLNSTCDILPNNAAELLLTSRPVERGVRTKGLYSTKHANWNQYTSLGKHCQLIAVILSIGFTSFFVSLTCLAHFSLAYLENSMSISEVARKKSADKISSSTQYRFIILLCTLVLWLLAAIFIYIQSYFGVFI